MGKNKTKAKAKTKADGAKHPAAKVANKLRKAGKKALKLVDQPAVSDIAAAAMMAAAAALGESKDKKKASGGKDVSVLIDVEAGKLADTLKAFAIDVARRTLETWEESSGGKTSAAADRKRAG